MISGIKKKEMKQISVKKLTWAFSRLALLIVLILGLLVYREMRQSEIRKAQAAAGDLILLWDTGYGAVPGGWTSLSGVGGDFYQVLIRGAGDYLTGGTATHTHTVTTTVGTTAADSGYAAGTSNTNKTATGHNHPATTGGLDGSNLPSYRNLVVIRYSGVPSTLPAGIIALFDATPPSGWTQYSAQNGYYIQGEATAGGTGGNASNQHSHTVTITFSAPAVQNTKTGTTASIAGVGHIHTVSNQITNTVTYEPPYREVILAQKNSEGSLPNNMIGMFDNTSLPGGWSSLSGVGGDFENRFLKAAAAYGGSSGGGTHTHNDITSVVSGGSDYNPVHSGAAGTSATCSPTHTHTVDLTGFSIIAETDNLPPYRDVIIAKYTAPAAKTVIGDGTITKSSYRVQRSSTNCTVAVFTTSSTVSSDQITGITIQNSGSGNLSTDVSAVKLWVDNGSTSGQWDSTDQSTGTASAIYTSSAVFTGLTLPVNTDTLRNYVITYDISANAVNNDTLLAKVSTITCTNSVQEINDTDDITITIDTAAPTNLGCSQPVNNSYNIYVTTSLTCSTANDLATPIVYWFRLATNAGFSQGLQQSDWQSSTQWTPPTTLEVGTTYYWQVKAKDGLGNEGVYVSTQPDIPGYWTFVTSGTATVPPPPEVVISSITACDQCHEMPPYEDTVRKAYTSSATVVGDHALSIHVWSSSSSACELCHLSTTTENYATEHRNSYIDMRPSGQLSEGNYSKGSSFAQSNTPVTGYCQNTYCHGDGNSPQWGIETTDCNSCHESEGAGGVASYEGSHQKHVSNYGYSCEFCHAREISGEGVVVTHSTGRAQGTANPGGGGTVGTNQDVEIRFRGGASANWTLNDNYGNSATSYSYRRLYSDPYRTETAITPKYTEGSLAVGSPDDNNSKLTWSGGQCTNIWCHSNANPDNGTVEYATATWGGAAGCETCHKGAGTEGGIALSSGHAKHTDAALYGYTCNRCHDKTADSNSALDSLTGYQYHLSTTTQKDVYFDALNPAGTYSDPNCSNLYCHGDGINNSGAVAWNTIDKTCTSCHYGNKASGSAMNTLNHNVHITTSGIIGVNYGCKNCHDTTVSNDTTILTYAEHVDGTKDIDVTTTLNPSGQWAVAGSSKCSNLYCHSDGLPQAVRYYSTATWDGSTLDCTGCHGSVNEPDKDPLFTTTYGGPNYNNDGLGKAKSNSHRKHVSSAADCKECHGRTVDNTDYIINNSTRHINQVREVSSGSYSGAPYFTYSVSGDTKTCANIGVAGQTCHGAGTARWGATLDCANCHTKDGDDIDDYVYGGGSPMAMISTNSTYGWYGSTHSSHPSGPLTCTNGNCHDPDSQHNDTNNPFRLRVATYSYTTEFGCKNCHSELRHSSTTCVGDSWGQGSFSPVQDYKCIDCHDPHKDRNFFRPTLGVSQLVQARVSRRSSDDRGRPRFDQVNFSTTPVNFTLTIPVKATDYVMSIGTNTAICQTCHQANAYYNISWGSTTQHNGSGNTACTDCHKHNNGFAATCLVCHGSPPVDTIAVPGNDTHRKHYNWVASTPTTYGTGAEWTANLSSGNVYIYGCGKCHKGADHLTGAQKTSTHTVEVLFDATVAPMNISPATYTRLAYGTTHQYNTDWRFLYYNNGRCDDTYCHGRLKSAPNNTIGISSRPAWGGVMPADPGTKCASACHNISTATESGLTHRIHRSSYGYTCDYCHYDTASSTYTVRFTSYHVNGLVNWDFDENKTLIGTTGSKYKGSGESSTGTAGVYSSYYCTNLYCHSNGRSGAAVVYSSATWGDPLDCTGCHGNNKFSSNAMNTASHDAHISTTGVTGVYYRCYNCHDTLITSDDQNIVTISSHVNKTRNVVFSSTIAPQGKWEVAKCSNVYCHSNGLATAVIVYSTPTWGVETSTCGYCHGREAVSIWGEPKYTNAGIGQPKSNSHQKHVGSASDCVYCHSGTTDGNGYIVNTSTKHIDKIREVQGGGGKSFTYTVTQDTKTCSGIQPGCHGGGQAKWGGASLQCYACHVSTYDQTSYKYNDGTMALISTYPGRGWYDTGHGRPNTSYYNSSNRGAGLNSCLYCHSSGTVHMDGRSGFYRLYVSSDSTVCLNCHKQGAGAYKPAGTDLAAVDASTEVAGAHVGSRHATESGYTDGGYFCWDCHDAHGDWNSVTISSPVGHMIQLNPAYLTEGTTEQGDAYGVPRSTTLANLVNGVRFYAPYNNWDSYVSTNPIAGVCQVCHDATVPHYNTTTFDEHKKGSDCMGCHKHNEDFKPAGCSGCHGADPAWWPQFNTVVISSYPNRVGSHKKHIDVIRYRSGLSTSTDAGQREICAYCHDDPSGIGGGTHYPGGYTPADRPADLPDVAYSSAPFYSIIKGSTDTAPYGYIQHSSSKCYNVDCHADVETPNWYVPPTVSSCSYCHSPNGVSWSVFVPTSNAHVKHSTPSYTYGTPAVTYSYKYDCRECHISNYNASPSSYAHTDGYVSMAFNNVFAGQVQANPNAWYDKNNNSVNNVTDSTFTYGTSGSGPCYNIYCHRPSSYTVITWAESWDTKTGWGGFNRCNKCHELPPTLTAPRISSHTHYGNHTMGSTGTVNASTQVFASGQQGGESGGYNFGCANCHPDPTSNATKHAKGRAYQVGNATMTANLTFASTILEQAQNVTWSTGSVTKTDTRGFWFTNTTCNSTFCHGTKLPGGMRIESGTSISTPSWGVNLADESDSACGACHNRRQAKSGTHAKHVSTYTYSCELCHYDSARSTYTVMSSSHHVDGKASWNLGNESKPLLIWSSSTYKKQHSGSTGTFATYGAGVAISSCTNLYCHSRGQWRSTYKEPISAGRWGGNALDCTGCHGGRSVSGTGNYLVLTSSHFVHVSTDTAKGKKEYVYPCEACHKYTVTGSTTIANYNLHVSSMANVAFSTNTWGWNRTIYYNKDGVFNISAKTCTKTYCHSDGTARKIGSLTQWTTPQWLP